jgi:hypothetical protein
MNLNPLSLAIVNPRGAGVAAALFEDFTNSAVDFDSSITFTRGSQAMYFDSTGTLKFAPSNMIRNNTMVGAVAGVTRSNGTITSASRTASTTVVVASTSHTVSVGDMITVSGATPSAYNGTFIVSAVVANVSYSYVSGSSATDSASGYTVSVMSPGTLPTNWSITLGAGIASSIVGTGTESGISYIDLRLAGLSPGVSSIDLFFDALNAAAALTGQTWDQSYYHKLAGGSASGISGFFFRANEYTAASAFITGQTSTALTTPTSADLNTQRMDRAVTLIGGATTAFISDFLRTNVTAATINITLRIGLPQLQMGSEATPAIRTSGSAVYLPRSNAYQDYNPSTLAPLGFLIEEQRTNLLTYSAEFDNAAWGKSNCTITANSVTSPAGTTTGDTLTTTVAGGAMNQTTQAFSAGSTVTITVFAKKNTSNFLRMELGNLVNCWFNLNTGATASNGAGSGNVLFSAKSIQAINNGWYRCTLTVTTSVLTTLNVLLFATDTDGNSSLINSSIYLWGAQAEVGAFATSYIATTTAAATRLADSASITGTNFSQWYNQTEGTFALTYDLAAQKTGAPATAVFAACDGSTTSEICIRQGTTLTGLDYLVTGAVDTTSYLFTNNATIKSAVTYKASDFANVLNTGEAVGTTSSGSIPAGINKLVLMGRDNSTQSTGHLRRFAYYRARLSNASLQSLST